MYVNAFLIRFSFCVDVVLEYRYVFLLLNDISCRLYLYCTLMIAMMMVPYYPPRLPQYRQIIQLSGVLIP